VAKISNFRGLENQKNSFNQSSGSFETAENAVLQQDEILSKRRGYKLFYETPTGTPLNLFNYKDSLIYLHSSGLQKYNLDASYNYSSTTTLSGQTFTCTYPYSTQAAGNLYVMTDGFLLKMEDTTSSLLKAGVAKAPDLEYLALGSGTTNSPITGIHTPDTQIGYRVVFGRKDVNSNLVLGAPSELTINSNTLYTASSVSLSTYTVTVTYNSHGLVTNDFVTIRNSNGTVAVPDGEYVITAYTANTFDFSTAAVLSSAPSGVTALNFGIRRSPKLEFTVPSDVNTTAFIYQIYRTDASLNNTVEPDESTLQQVYEANLTSSNLSNGYIQYTDTVDDLFKQGYLYTNPNTGEGIAQANFTAPIGRDLAFFKDVNFIAYPTTNYNLNINLIRASASTFTNGDYIDVVQVERSRTATASTWQSGTTVRYSISSTSNLQTGQYVLFTGFVNSANNGKFIITAIGSGYIDCTNAGRTDASLNESGVTATCYPARRYVAAASASYNSARGGDFVLSTGSSSVATNIDATARSICKTINRDTASTIYASYTSSTLSLPGQMFWYGREVTNQFAIQANTSTVGSNFDPTLPTTASDISTVVGTNLTLQNGLYYSKFNEFEAFPLLNYILVGAKNAEIIRIAPLKNSLIVLKEDGIWRITGNAGDYSIFLLDSTVICKAKDSVQILNNSVYCLTNQGVVQISENGVSIISRQIEPSLVAVLNNANIDTYTFGHAQESNRLYLLSTIAPNDNSTTITYCYNTLTQNWTTWTIFPKRGTILFANDTYYTITTGNVITKERKSQTKLDYCDYETSTVTVNSVSGSTADITSTLSLEVGDIIVYNNVINRITAVVNSSITFYQTVNFIAGDSVTHYKRIVTRVITAPEYGGNPTQLKHYSEISMAFRNSVCKSTQVGFISEAFETDYYDWTAPVDTTLGWGTQPWGISQWGGDESIITVLETYSSQPLRSFIPHLVQYATWLKVKINHFNAGESINLQTINLKSRKVSERISK
jgi:hypothetical protein